MTNTETVTYYVREVDAHTWAHCTFPYSPLEARTSTEAYCTFFYLHLFLLTLIFKPILICPYKITKLESSEIPFSVKTITPSVS